MKTPFLPSSVLALIVASGRFRVEMRARWQSGIGSGQRAGVAFNVDQVGSLLTCYAVANGNNGGTNFDSIVSGVADGSTVNNAADYDSSVDWTALHVDAWIDTTSGYCTYQYGPIADALGVNAGIQKRKTSLVTAGGTGLAVYTVGGVGHLDIAELIVWKNERSW